MDLCGAIIALYLRDGKLIIRNDPILVLGTVLYPPFIINPYFNAKSVNVLSYMSQNYRIHVAGNCCQVGEFAAVRHASDLGPKTPPGPPGPP